MGKNKEIWDGTVYQLEGRKVKLTLSDKSIAIGYGNGIADASTDDLDIDGIIIDTEQKNLPLMIYTADLIKSVEFLD